MEVSFGNLSAPYHSINPDKPEAKDKVLEMMGKLHQAGFKRIEKTEDIDNEPKSYHIYSLPHKMHFSSHGDEAIEIMTPYSDYMKPLIVEAYDISKGKGG